MAFAKSLPQRIATAFRGTITENIVFLRIPKTASTSINQALIKHYLTLDMTRDRCIARLDPIASSKAAKIATGRDYPHTTTDDYPLLKMREDLLLYFMSQGHVRYVAGHFPFSDTAHRAFHDKFAFITVLRDPIKRWISSYF